MMKKQAMEQLVQEALEAKEHAYAPYSKFYVGACVLADNGKTYCGANLENSSYGAAICAERGSIFKAVYDGAKKIQCLAVVSSNPELCMPCGICRQVMLEFAAEDFFLISANRDGEYQIFTMEEILPNAFVSF